MDQSVQRAKILECLMNEALPTISVITVSLNCEKNLEECYKRIRAQDYPQEKIELILVDGGSTDGTKEVAEDFSAKIIEGGFRDNQEARRFIGFKYARKEILVYLDSDNFLPDKNWLRKMVEPFIDGEINATQTLRYAHNRNHKVMNRYFSLFGVNDPAVLYLHKADRIPYYGNIRDLSAAIVEEKAGYYKVRFTPEGLPTIGCNGFLVRRKLFEKLTCAPEQFFHIDVNLDLIKMGFNTYGIVKTDIEHLTNETLIRSILKRLRYMKTHHSNLSFYRRYKVFNIRSQKDIKNLLKFIFFSLTFIKPLFDSMKGYRKINDPAWFIHPAACFLFMCAYGLSVFLIFANNKKGRCLCQLKW